MSRDFEQFCSDNSLPHHTSSSFFPERSHRAGSLSRQNSSNDGYLSPTRTRDYGGSHMLGQGRRQPQQGGFGGRRGGTPLLDDDDGSMFMSRFGPQTGGGGGFNGGGAGGGFAGSGSLMEDRGRGDWRRVSVPERGKDFKSLPRKYNR